MQVIRNESDRDLANFVLQMFVAASTIGVIFYCLWTLTTVELKQNNNNAFLMLLGGALSWMGMLMAFCFPNSIGTQKKDDTIAKAVNKLPGVEINASAGSDRPGPGIAVTAGGPTTINDASTGDRTTSGVGGESIQDVPGKDSLDSRRDKDRSELADGVHGVRNWQDIFGESSQSQLIRDWPDPVHGGDSSWPWDEHSETRPDDR